MTEGAQEDLTAKVAKKFAKNAKKIKPTSSRHDQKKA